MSVTVRLHPLLTGELLAPRALLARSGNGPIGQLRALGLGARRDAKLWIPVPAFLIEHPDRGPLLIDTGLPERALTDVAGGLGRIGDRLYDVRMTPEQPVLARLRAHGIDPADLETVVMTHLHLDHAAGMPELPGATFAADEREWAAADGRLAITSGYHAPHFANARRRVLDLASAGEPWAGFERTLDLHGDGSVRLLSTPGHTPGHLSVAVALKDRHAIMTADLAYTHATVRGETEPGLADDYGELRRSLAQLRAHLSEHPGTLVIPGHDPVAWARLDVAYA